MSQSEGICIAAYGRFFLPVLDRIGFEVLHICLTFLAFKLALLKKSSNKLYFPCVQVGTLDENLNCTLRHFFWINATELCFSNQVPFYVYIYSFKIVLILQLLN